MRKALRIIAISAGIISILATVILAFIYMEKILSFINTAKEKIKEKADEKRLELSQEIDFNFDED